MVSAVSATIFQWRAKELIWCFWGASLGVSVFGTFLLVGLSLAEDRRRKAKDSGLIFGIILGSLVGGVLAALHLAGGRVLAQWFPLGDNTTSPLQIIWAVFSSYWTIILSTMFFQFISYPRYGLHNAPEDPKGKKYDADTDPFLEPFRNAARLLVIIALLIGIMKMTDSFSSETLGIAERIIVYAVLFISFFPFIPVGRKRRIG